ncbi:MAG: N-acetyltransferase family protein [Bacteroidota bacterium]
MQILPLLPSHWPDVKRIFEEGIATGLASLETSAPTWEFWDKHHDPRCRIVAVEREEVMGWAALTPVSHRCVYGGVSEVSIYIGEAHRGRGIGKKLFQALIDTSEEAGFWTLESIVFQDNVPSIKLHEAVGFRQVGYREKIAEFKGKWINTVLLERRSKAVGVVNR